MIYAPAEIHILAEHEVLFVECADLIDNRTAHHQRRSRHPVYIQRRVMVKLGEQIAAGESVFWEKPSQWRIAEKSGTQVWVTSAGVLQRSILIQELRSHHTSVWMCVGITNK